MHEGVWLKEIKHVLKAHCDSIRIISGCLSKDHCVLVIEEPHEQFTPANICTCIILQ